MAGAGKVVESPISGAVCALLVATGGTVNVGDELVILESMKMEIPVEAPVAGTVTEIVVSVGERVAEGGRLLVLA